LGRKSQAEPVVNSAVKDGTFAQTGDADERKVVFMA
jgi:hypothetical protein